MMGNRRFIFGLCSILAAAVVVGALGVGNLYLLGIPILLFVPGILLVWKSKVGPVYRLAAILAIVPLTLGIFLLGLWLRTEPRQIYLIPAGYRGNLVVFFGEDCGKEELYEGSKVVLEIPVDGILITQFETNSGYLNNEFVQTDSEGKLHSLPQFQWQNFETERKYASRLTEETVGVFWSYGSPTYFTSKRSRAWVITDYRDFGAEDQKERMMERDRFGRLADEKLRKCRSTESR